MRDLNPRSSDNIMKKKYFLDQTLVERWAPLIWLSPKERYFPLSVPEFLQNVEVNRLRFPENEYYLRPKDQIGNLP